MSHRSRRKRFETRVQPLLPRPAFALRVIRFFLASFFLIAGSLFIGMLGYHFIEGMEWIDAFLNASMILSGMGPLGPLNSWGCKLFSGLYALYSGLILIVASGLLLAPFLHRLLHHFHIDDET